MSRLSSFFIRLYVNIHSTSRYLHFLLVDLIMLWNLIDDRNGTVPTENLILYLSVLKSKGMLDFSWFVSSHPLTNICVRFRYILKGFKYILNKYLWTKI